MPGNLPFPSALTAGQFDLSEICDLDIAIACFILPRLREFRKTTERTPSCDMTMQQWTAILDKMVFSFDRIAHGTEQDTPQYAAYKAAIWNNKKDLSIYSDLPANRCVPLGGAGTVSQVLPQFVVVRCSDFVWQG